MQIVIFCTFQCITLNLVLHNIPEPNTIDSSTRKQEDISQVNSILDKYVDVKLTINNPIRLEKKEANKARLLKITLASTQEKVLVLRNKLKLRKESNPEHIKKIFITPDYTPLEQKKNKALREQLSEMNKVQNIYRIKNGEIVRKEV